MKNIFDDQHQKMSSWLDKLAADEASNFSKDDLKDEEVAEKKAAEYKGISSTWDTKKKIESTMLDDTSRRVSNRPEPKINLDEVEKQARQLLMTGLNIEKLATVLKKKYSKQIVDNFMQTKIASIEKEFGKLGYLYVDASLVGDCADLSEILKTSNKVASIAVHSVKKIGRCDDCNCNKRSHCVKLGLEIVDQPAIKTAKEAKSIINKFASLKYVNSYFIKSEELTKYYDRLASENPEKVVRDFLIDIENRRQAKQELNIRLAAKETSATEPKKKASTVKFGRKDIEVSNAFKQFLIQNQSLRAAKSTLSKRYGEDRVKAYIKEAREELNRYIKFVTVKPKTASLRDEAVESSSILENKQSMAKIASATKMAYSLKTFRLPLQDIEKNIARTYGSDVAKVALDKLSNDAEARLLGLTYIDSNLYSNGNEVKDVLNILKRKSNNTIFQIKEGSACKLANNPEGVCSITGLTIVKDASVNSKEQAMKLIAHLKNEKFANEYELDKLASQLVDGDNSSLLASFISSRKPTKMLPSKLVRQASDVALKYAKDLQTIRKIGRMSWSSTKLLTEALESNVINKQAFATDIAKIFDKSASDANVYLDQPNQYTMDVFTDDKDKVSDVTLGTTI